MAFHAHLRLDLGSADVCAAAQAALAPDHDGHVASHCEGRVLVVEAGSATPMGLLRGLDDVLGCLRALGHA